MEEIRIIKIEETVIIFKRRHILPAGSSWDKFKFKNSLLSKELQQEIKNFIRYKKLKNVISR